MLATQAGGRLRADLSSRAPTGLIGRENGPDRGNGRAMQHVSGARITIIIDHLALGPVTTPWAANLIAREWPDASR